MFARSITTTLLLAGLASTIGASALHANGPIQGEALQVRQIRTQPGHWENRIVVLEGMVERIATGRNAGSADATKFYNLRDAFGDVIRVRTTGDVPDQRVLYRLRGAVSIDSRGTVYVTEEARSVVPLSTVQGFQPNAYQEPVIDAAALIEAPSQARATSQTLGLGMLSTPSNGSGTAMWLIAGLAIGALGSLAAWRWLGGQQPIRRSQQLASGAFGGTTHASGAGEFRNANDPFAAAPRATSALHEPVARPVFHNGTVRVLPAWMEITGPSSRPIRFFSPPAGAHGAEITFGREAGDPYGHVQLHEQTVSRRQARLCVIDGRYDLENLSATNPTLVNDQPLVSGRVPLRDGDLIRMGEVLLRFRHNATTTC
jgi:HAMP domain-containing protein